MKTDLVISILKSGLSDDLKVAVTKELLDKRELLTEVVKLKLAILAIVRTYGEKSVADGLYESNTRFLSLEGVNTEPFLQDIISRKAEPDLTITELPDGGFVVSG